MKWKEFIKVGSEIYYKSLKFHKYLCFIEKNTIVVELYLKFFKNTLD